MGESYEVSKLTELIDKYLNGEYLEKTNAELDIKNRIIDGEDLISAFINIEKEREEEQNNYNKLKSLIYGLEPFITNKSGTLVDKIKEIITLTKKEEINTK